MAPRPRGTGVQPFEGTFARTVNKLKSQICPGRSSSVKGAFPQVVQSPPGSSHPVEWGALPCYSASPLPQCPQVPQCRGLNKENR